MIIIDEAAHIPTDLFYEVIVPILEMTMTALLAISTPLDEFNYYSKLVTLKDENGEPFFVTIEAGRICDDCSRLPYEVMIKCDHVEDTAHWKNPHKLKRLKVLFEGDEARGLRELGGIAASDFTACFQKAYIEALMNAPRYVTRTRPDTIYLTVDPNGGGPSKMAMCSGFLDGKRLVVSYLLFLVLPPPSCTSLPWGGTSHGIVHVYRGGEKLPKLQRYVVLVGSISPRGVQPSLDLGVDARQEIPEAVDLGTIRRI